MLLALIPLFLAQGAQAGPAFVGNWVSVAVVLGGGIIAIGIQYGMLQTSRQQLRAMEKALEHRNPPLAEDVHRTFIPRIEHDDEVKRLDGRIDAAFNEIGRLQGAHTKAFGDVERAIGRIEGKLDAIGGH
jgi:hypothetical protein